MTQNAISVTRSQDFAAWYQAVLKEADMAENSPVRGCMIIKPWGYGIWELIQQDLDRRIKETGHQNCYFPLFIPLSFIAKEAEHVEGFAKEMAIVTHHRLIERDGQLIPDPDAKLAEPLIIRPTSETIIGDAFRRWIQSEGDLPILINQWANVVRWEQHPRLFLRTSEFLWQEGHTAHASGEEAIAETMKMLAVYKALAEDVLAIAVVDGEKSANERFPGAVSTFSIEAMMQDGKALQAGTSHYLGTHFAEAQDIKFDAIGGGTAFAHTTSWGVSTRLVGSVVMNHGDDDGLMLPPKISPYQVVIIPVLVGGQQQEPAVKEFCASLAAELSKLDAFGAPLRVHLDLKVGRHAAKRWDWVRRGAPVICELGTREASAQTITYLRRDQFRGEKGVITSKVSRQEFTQTIAGVLRAIQADMFARSKKMLHQRICRDVQSVEALKEYFDGTRNTGDTVRGWVQVPWCRPEKSQLNEIGELLRTLKLTIRNIPLADNRPAGKCIFTGRPAVEEIVIGGAY